MVLAFKEKFVEPILKGTKIHTIRADKGNRWKKGNLINMATGVRTPNYKEFKRCVCVSTQKIEIEWNSYIDRITNVEIKYFHLKVDGFLLTTKESNELIKNDDFNYFSDFCLFFPENFKGKLIHWTNKTY